MADHSAVGKAAHQCGFAPALEIEARGEEPGVIIGRRQRAGTVAWRDRELVADAEGEEPIPAEREPADDKPRCEEQLIEPVALPAVVIGPVCLDLRPEYGQYMVLKRDIGLDLVAQRVRVRIRQDGADRALDVEIAPALAEGEGGI